MVAFMELEDGVPKDHPLRTIKAVAVDALERLSAEFDRMYSKVGLSVPIANFPVGGPDFGQVGLAAPS